MSVHKRKTRSKASTWAYHFDAPDSTPEKRIRVSKSGFTTKKAAQEAEALRRVEVATEYEAKKNAKNTIPKTLGDLLAEYCTDCAIRKRAPITISRYRDFLDYFETTLLAMQLGDVTTLHLHHEWIRLVQSGGRGKRKGNPLAPKTVRNMAGLVSSAYGRAMFWGLTDRNPAKHSEPPKKVRREVITLTPEQTSVMVDTSLHPAIPMLLDLLDATGARRGEMMASRWSDIRDGRITIGRSLSQVGKDLFFKSVKQERVRVVSLPDSVIPVLEAYRKKQAAFRRLFGPDYKTDQDLIICNPDGSPLKPDSISASVSRLCKKLKLPKGVSLHTLRHTHASQLLADGMEITAVAARLGHSDTNTTLDVYGHAIRGRDDVAAKLINTSREKARAGKDRPQ